MAVEICSLSLQTLGQLILTTEWNFNETTYHFFSKTVIMSKLSLYDVCRHVLLFIIIYNIPFTVLDVLV